MNARQMVEVPLFAKMLVAVSRTWPALLKLGGCVYQEEPLPPLIS